MAERFVGTAQHIERLRQRFEERFQFGNPSCLGIRHRAGEPRRDVCAHQNVSVPRTLIGTMWIVCATGSVKRFTEDLNATSTPNGPDVTPPPPSTK